MKYELISKVPTNLSLQLKSSPKAYKLKDMHPSEPADIFSLTISQTAWLLKCIWPFGCIFFTEIFIFQFPCLCLLIVF